MEQLKEFHHFKKDLIASNDRLAKCERYLVDTLLDSKIPDSKRDSSICWELKHQASCRQFAAVLALKRGLPIEVCLIGLLFHDFSSAYSGKYKEHAHQSAELSKEILNTTIKGFSDEELDQIWRIIYHHSDKHIWTDDPFQEFGKDVDVLDCFLYQGAFDYYLGNKPLPVFKEYLRRAKKVWVELELPVDTRFNLLDGYGNSWFQLLFLCNPAEITTILAMFFELSKFSKNNKICFPPFCVILDNSSCSFYGNHLGFSTLTNGIDDKSIDMKQQAVLKFMRELLNGKHIPKMKRGIISDESLNEAEIILINSGRMSGLSRRILLFWPIVDIYESLSGNSMLVRLKELGIKLDDKEV